MIGCLRNYVVGNYVIDQNIKSSDDSIARMKRDKQEFEETDAVKEYRFITQQMKELDNI